MPQEINNYGFSKLDFKTLKEALQNGSQRTDFDASMRRFYNKESYDAGIPRILNRKERRKIKAIYRRKGLSNE